MEILDIKVEGRKSLTLPWEEIQIMPIGDVQMGAQGVDVKRLCAHVRWGLAQGNVYFLGMGDYIDIMSPSNREAWRSARVYDSVRSALSSKAEEVTNMFLDAVKGSEGRWLGVLEGHHYFEYEDGTTSDTRIARALKTTFLGTCAFVRLVFSARSESNKGHSLKCTIWCHHGAGNGLTPHSPLARLYHVMHQFDADIYLIGHQTKKPAVKVPVIGISDKPPYRLVGRNKILAGTGGFIEGYPQGSKDPTGMRPQGSYVEQGLLSPVALGGIILKVRPIHKGSPPSDDRVDIHCEI